VSYEVTFHASALDDAFEQHMWGQLVGSGWWHGGGWRQRHQKSSKSSSSTLCRVARFVFLDPFVLVLLFPALQLLLVAQRAGYLCHLGGASGGDAGAGAADAADGVVMMMAAAVVAMVLCLKLVSVALDPAYNGGVVDLAGPRWRHAYAYTVLAVAVAASLEVLVAACCTAVGGTDYIGRGHSHDHGNGDPFDELFRISNQSVLHGPLLTLLLLFPLPWRFFAPIASMLAASTLAVWSGHVRAAVAMMTMPTAGSGDADAAGTAVSSTIDDYCVTVSFYVVYVLAAGYQRFQYQQARDSFEWHRSRSGAAPAKARATAVAVAVGGEGGGDGGGARMVPEMDGVVCLKWANFFKNWFMERHLVGR
jgi:hypothetical protein